MSEAAFVSASEISRVAVLGAGTMGHGIAQVAAMAGHSVSMRDINEEALSAALKKISVNLDKGVERGKVDRATRDRALELLSTGTDLEAAVRDADLVIEAVPEIPELKREILGQAARVAPARAIIATNTSSLSITSLAAAIETPARLIGMHFFNPVHIMKLVEVVKHEASDPAVVATACAVAENMGKTAITVADAPGFASSRLGLAIGLEAMRMVEQGVASAGDIDSAMKLGYGHPMGPLELTDHVGLDVRLQIADYLATTLGPVFEAPAVLRQKVAAGLLGKKSGEGFYRWVDGKKQVD